MADENHTQMLLQQPTAQQQQIQQSQTGTNVEQANQMNVTTSVPINVATINVSQPQQMQTIQQNVNASSGAPVQMAVSQLTAQAQTVQAGSMMSQSSGPHPTMIHPTMSMAQSPLQHVQVIQQPLSTPYLQHVYTPQQQMVFPGNLTLQHAGMTTPAIQSIGATQGLSLQLQAKPTLDPKGQATGQTIQAVNAANKSIVNANTMMTASGQVIGTQKSFQPQMIAAGPGKSAIIHSQSGFAPSNANQTVVIGPVGVLPNQQQIFNHKALTDTQKGKTYAFHNQPQTLQPKSIYSSSVPVHSSAQVFNGSHIKQITTQPQIITTQAPGTMFSQAQIFGISWATPGNFQSSTLLAQNPIILRSQQSDMFIQPSPQTAMHLPVAAATAPVPATTFAATPMVPQKHKQVRPGTQTVAVATQTMVSNAITVNSNTPPIRSQLRPKGKVPASPSYNTANVTPSTPPQMATTQTQTNSLAQPQLSPQQALQAKSDAANQTLPNQVKPIVSDIKSPTTQSKSVGVDAKQLLPELPERSQAMVIPTTKVVPTTVSSSIGTSVAITTTSVATVMVSTAPIVSTPVVHPTNTVVTMTSTETSTSPPPSSVVDNNVDTTEPEITQNSVSVPETVIEPTVTCEQETEMKVVAECETIIEELPVPPVTPPPAPPPVSTPILKPAFAPVKDKQPQKAIVKPQVLTHVIDGFVIQEGPEPFPVSRSSLLSDPSYRVMPPEKPKRTDEFTAGSPKKKLKIHSSRGNKELANCEFCGILGEKSKFKRSKRFCSLSCAKGRKSGRLLPTAEGNVAAGPGRKRKMGFRGRKGQRKQNQKILNDMEVENETTPTEETVSDVKKVDEVPPVTAVSEVLPTETPAMEKIEEVKESVESNPIQKLPTKWSVQEVFDFIKELPGCSDYADVFRSQEIDGQALLLLKEDHLMTNMCMKLGPALKLISHINTIKEELSLHT